MVRPRLFALALSASFAVSVPAFADFTMEQVLHYPFTDGLASAEHADRIAWVRDLAGVRNVWVADGPAFKPHQVTQYNEDDGQEITQLTFSPDGSHLLYVRGGDHDANWPAEGNLAPDPNNAPDEPKVTIWSASLSGDAPTKLAEGDAPALSANGVLAFIKDHQVWTTTLDGKGKAERLFFDRGKDRSLRWSPDGSKLAFVSDRGDHAFVGVFEAKDKPLLYLAPTTNFGFAPRWSPDGTRIAFACLPGDGGAPKPILKRVPLPWSLWVADAASGEAHRVWQSPDTLDGSYPDTEGETNLHWGAGDRLVFLADLDGWPHLYSISANGGAPLLLTPGPFMVEHVSESRDLRFMIYDANTGTNSGDFDRRHVFEVPVDRAAPAALTSGSSLEWSPVAASDDRAAFISSGPQQPPVVGTVGFDGGPQAGLEPDAVPSDFPATQLVVPTPVTFKAADGLIVHGQIFRRPEESRTKPGIIFVHGGPPRQMLLGWHYMGYYSNAYAVNQYLAAHGFVVLSVNYRLGIGYGRAFHEPDRWGPTGASEYQDVVAGARFLQKQPGVDAKRIGIWGGSYGGYLTAMGLARNSDIFKAGVDFHGVHDWSLIIHSEVIANQPIRYEKGDQDAAMKIAFASSPDSAIAKWKSPVLLIQGDDDRNVQFHQTVDLARRLDERHVSYEELVIPNEIHGFLRYQSWRRADEANVEYLARELGAR
jgi:dipeptidyl aminopeptidase/acylaminoacyl peptidase